MIRIAGLRVLYGSFAAVDGLDLDIRRGELFGLIGPNGAGKSTTIRVLIGQRRPSGGSVTIAGHDVIREWSRIKPQFGYVPDRENHFEEFTGRRNRQGFAGDYSAQMPVQGTGTRARPYPPCTAAFQSSQKNRMQPVIAAKISTNLMNQCCSSAFALCSS